MSKLHKKWFAAKARLAKATAEEAELRDKIKLEMTEDKLKIQIGDSIVRFQKNPTAYIPAASMTAIKDTLKTEVFEKVFYANYRLKPAQYEALTGKSRKVIAKHLTMRDAPLKVTIADA